MKFTILTLFPEFFQGFTESSIIKKSLDRELIQIEIKNIRDFSTNKHNKTDDYPYGGGPGMVMTPQPIADSIRYVKEKDPGAKVVYFTPRGKVFTQEDARGFAREGSYILLCGHYEGVDQRIIDKYVDVEISAGDFILTGGEIPALIFMDALTRLQEGVLGNEESASDESFSENLLEYPQYTRPPLFEDLEVPEVLLSGNHKEIDRWRLEKSLEITERLRPDLYEKHLGG
ncbi:MAG: tRNA (guanosine(37)-N1)-methyltransferase TrmD [Eubacteriaceae bacterium]|nr:tRNA (guanosine(37)-N1)-methyltransferase TrmD [Eubacteriaceae bacterium]